MEIMQGSDLLSAKLKLTLRYSVHRQTLVVNVHNIEELHFDEEKNLYVKLNILPDKLQETEKKTQVAITSKNPVFDHTFEYAIPQEEFDNKHLQVLVLEETQLKQDLPIAQVTIDLNKLGLVLPYTRFYRLSKIAH